MELIVQLLLVLAALSALFQMSHWGILARLVAAIVIAGFAYLTYPWIIEQSKEQLNIWIKDTGKMQNLAVLLVIEALFFILIDLVLLKKYFGQSIDKWIKYVSYFPGVLIFAVVLYIQMRSFYLFSSIDFDTLGMYFALGLSVLVFVGPWGVRWTIPEHYLRLELRYILNFGLILGGIVITVFCQGLVYPRQLASFEWTPLVIVTGISFVTILGGWLGSRLMKRIKFQWKY